MGKVPIVSVKVPIVSVKQHEKSPVQTRLKSDEIPFTLRETILLYHGRRLDMIQRYGRVRLPLTFYQIAQRFQFFVEFSENGKLCVSV